MEVHHHAHHEGKKNWKAYFWEFLMLFLAVFCGFLAEYQLEHKIERDREKEYIHSIVNDLKTDTAKLNTVIAEYQKGAMTHDTLLMNFSAVQNAFDEKTFMKILTVVNGYPDFIYTDATIQQLKNSGGFRILRNRKDIDSIMAYDGIVKKALLNEGFLGRSLEGIVSYTFDIFSYQKVVEQLQRGKTYQQLKMEHFNWLLTNDKNTLDTYANRLLAYTYTYKNLLFYMQEVKRGATRLLHYLEKEYHLK